MASHVPWRSPAGVLNRFGKYRLEVQALGKPRRAFGMQGIEQTRVLHVTAVDAMASLDAQLYAATAAPQKVER
jgi:hypothetical protein